MRLYESVDTCTPADGANGSQCDRGLAHPQLHEIT